MTNFQSVKDNLENSNQPQILRFTSELSDEERSTLFSQINALNLQELNESFENALKLSKSTFPEIQSLSDDEWSGLKHVSISEIENYKEIGLKSISNGDMAVALLAGGQGTRLGVDYPKGMYDVGLPSHKTLFQIHSERILRLEHLVFESCGKNVSIPWLIMTSDFTNDQTERFFQENDYFGLTKSQVHIFEQGLFPAFDFEGKLLLQSKGSLALSPNGNGDFFRALEANGILKMTKEVGIKYIYVFAVDNILVKVGDPIFLGYMISKEAECGIKVIERLQPEEALGSVCKLKDGSYAVVEYSEITETDRSKRASDGSLYLKAGNICIHVFSVDFIGRLLEDPACRLPYHIAKKKITCLDSDGVLLKPEKPNGIKLEKFIFDCVPFTRKLAVWEVQREEEFAPLKNSVVVPSSNPTTARKAFLDLGKEYFLRQNPHVSTPSELEVSPLASYWDEGLAGLDYRDMSGNTVYITRDAPKGHVVIRPMD